jgi:hypothetical protein
MSARRLSVRDRYFASTEVAKIVGPIAAPSADAVRAVLTDMHADRPHAKAFSRLDVDGGRWRPIAAGLFGAWAHDLVVDLAGEEDPDRTTARMLAEPMGQRPFPGASRRRGGGERGAAALGAGDGVPGGPIRHRRGAAAAQVARRVRAGCVAERGVLGGGGRRRRSSGPWMPAPQQWPRPRLSRPRVAVL